MSSWIAKCTGLGLFLLTFLSACDHSKPPQEQPIANTSCAELGKILPADFIHGTVRVPEDYDHPEGPHIRVFYYGRLSQGDTPTIVFYNGGPGGDSHSSFRNLSKVTETDPETKAKYPILYIDQRGTGCSDHYPEATTTESLLRLAHYGSTEIVKDSEVIRNALLGKKKWKVFGQSFGGLIAKRYLEVAPEGVRSLHIHGYSSGNDAQMFLQSRLQAQNRLMHEFFDNYSGAEQTYTTVENLLTPEVCVSQGEQKFCGTRILYSMTSILGFHNYWDWMNKTLESFLSGGKLVQKGLMAYAQAALFDSSTSKGSWAGTVITWVDEDTGSWNAKTCSALYLRLKASGETPDTWPLHECKSTMIGLNPDAEVKDVYQQYLNPIPQQALTLDRWEKAVRLHPEIPIFLYSGAKDGFVPAESFADEVNRLGSLIHYTEFSRSGHEGFRTENKVWMNLHNDLATSN